MAKLNLRQKAFCDEYLKDLNATQAAIRAGYSPKTAAVIAAENLKKPNIQEYIQQAMAKRSQRTEITQDRVLRELAVIAFSRPADYVTVRDDVTTAIDTDRVDPEKAGAVAAYVPGRSGTTVRFHDKVKALELLGKHVGLFGDSRAADQQQSNLLEALTSATLEEVDTDHVPELEQAATAGNDMVEPADAEEL